MLRRYGITSLLVFSAILPAIAAYAILHRQALVVPFQDDYGAILAFAADYTDLPTWQAKVFAIATTQYNEYKLGVAHAIVAADLELTHHLSFAFLNALGDLFLLPIGYLLWLTYPGEAVDRNRRLLAFLPISLIFFSLSYWANLNWAVTGLQNTPVVLFAFLAIYLLAGGTALLLSCLAAALAAFTSANGFFLLPVGLWILLPRRAYASALLWSASFAVPLAAYLYRYQYGSPPVGKTMYRTLSFLGFLGGVVSPRWPAALLGLMLLAIFAFAVRSRFERTNPVAFYLAVWILATGVLVAWLRGATGYVITSRYSIYSNLMLIFGYAFLAHHLPRLWSKFNPTLFYAISIVCAVGLCVITDLSAYRELGSRRRMVLTGIEFYRMRPEVNSPMINPLMDISFPKEKARERTILNNVIHKHLYTLPPPQDIR